MLDSRGGVTSIFTFPGSHELRRRRPFGLVVLEVRDHVGLGVDARADVVVQHRGEFVSQSGCDVGPFASELVAPQARGMVAQVAVDDVLRPGALVVFLEEPTLDAVPAIDEQLGSRWQASSGSRRSCSGPYSVR